MTPLRHVEDAQGGQHTYCHRGNPPHPAPEKRSDNQAYRCGDQCRDDSEPNHINLFT